MRNGRADIAEMDFPKLIHLRESARGFEDVLAHVFAAFHPRPRAKADADVRAVGNLQRAHVAVKISENATRHAAKLSHGRIVRMNANAHADFLRDGHDLVD